MAESEILMDKWGFGMSSDEYTGGSYYYAQNIDTFSSDKYFRLSKYIYPILLNSRSNGYPITILDSNQMGLIGISYDGYIEANFNCEYNTNRGYGPLYRSSFGFRNAISLGDTTILIGNTGISRIDGDIRGAIANNNPDMTSGTSRTLGTGWTGNATGCLHTSGTASLTQAITITGSFKVIFKMTGCTTGTVNVKYNGVTLDTIGSGDNDKYLIERITGTGTSVNIEFQPTTGFNGTIDYCAVEDNNGATESFATITSSSYKPLLYKGGDLYIGSGNKISVLSTFDWTVEELPVVDDDYTIVKILEIGNRIILVANNGQDSKQYYRDGVSESADEVIMWKNKRIVNAEYDGSNLYATTIDGENRSLYMVSGYDRVLIAKSNPYYEYQSSDKEGYRLGTRFDFYPLYTNSMGVWGEQILVGAYNGVYSYGKTNTALNNAITKEYVIDGSVIHSIGTRQGVLYIGYKRNDNINCMGSVSSLDRYCSEGYLVSDTIIRDKFSTDKIINKLSVGYSLPKSTKITTYIGADDYYYWTFYVSGITVAPSVGGTYTASLGSYGTNTFKVMSVDITGGEGSFTCYATTLETNLFYVSDFYSKTHLIRTSGDGDPDIIPVDFDNFVKVNEITSDTLTYGRLDLVPKNFIDANIPEWNKIKIKIKLESAKTDNSPFIYDMGLLADTIKI